MGQPQARSGQKSTIDMKSRRDIINLDWSEQVEITWITLCKLQCKKNILKQYYRHLDQDEANQAISTLEMGWHPTEHVQSN